MSAAQSGLHEWSDQTIDTSQLNLSHRVGGVLRRSGNDITPLILNHRFDVTDLPHSVVIRMEPML